MFSIDNAPKMQYYGIKKYEHMFDKQGANGRYNMELCKMAQEYRRNTALLELRKKQLLAAKRHAKQYEVKYRLLRRIRTLNEMINESRLAAFEMEHYYEKEGEHVERKAV